MPFFEYCTKCRKVFTDFNAWTAHMRYHEGVRTAIIIGTDPEKLDEYRRKKAEEEKAGESPALSAAVIEDKHLEKAKPLREIKRKLREAGVECQTINAEEARALYLKCVEEGKI